MISAVRIVSGANDGFFSLPGDTRISAVRASLVDAFNVPGTAATFVNGRNARSKYRLRSGDHLEFIVPVGRKGGDTTGGEKRHLYQEEAKKAGEEIRQACENPERLVSDLARLVSRKKRKGVISDTWSYRNQLLVLRRGYSQARGSEQWAKVGRKVSGNPLFIVMPRFGTVLETPKTKGGKPRKHAKPVSEKRLFGFMGVPVYGLEQTTPAEDFVTEEKYSLFADPDHPEFIQVFDGYKVAWWKWYKQLSDVGDLLTGFLGAAIVAKCLDDATEYDDVLRKLRQAEPKEIAKRIERACKAAVNYLAGKKPE
jgi:hypothetical protein